jgi:uncharacterized Fe-S center protein
MNSLFSDGKAEMCDTNDQLTNRMNSAIRRNMGNRILFIIPTIMLALSGCVQVQAPDKPIVINLNIQIRQDVVYKLDKASKQLIDQEPGIY